MKKFKVKVEIDFEFDGKVSKGDSLDNIVCSFFDNMPNALSSVNYNRTKDFDLFVEGLSWEIQQKSSGATSKNLSSPQSSKRKATTK